jgi:transcriptional regulator with XRE-family HTH domain
MNTLLRIRLEVFGVSQREMARIACVTQSTISKWESGRQIPLATALENIRREAKRRRVRWNDRWFWEA